MLINSSISTFVSEISKRGFLRANRYVLSFPELPQSVSGGAGSAIADLSYRVSDFTLPGKSVATTETKIYGPVRQAPYATTYDQVTFSLLLSEGLTEREFFERWMNLIVDYTSHKIEYSTNYNSKMLLEVYNDGNTITQAYNFIDAFPMALGDVAFAYANEEPATCQITMSYLKYISTTSHENAARSADDHNTNRDVLGKFSNPLAGLGDQVSKASDDTVKAIDDLKTSVSDQFKGKLEGNKYYAKGKSLEESVNKRVAQAKKYSSFSRFL
jgi:hypothetical protein